MSGGGWQGAAPSGSPPSISLPSLGTAGRGRCPHCVSEPGRGQGQGASGGAGSRVPVWGRCTLLTQNASPLIKLGLQCQVLCSDVWMGTVI